MMGTGWTQISFWSTWLTSANELIVSEKDVVKSKSKKSMSASTVSPALHHISDEPYNIVAFVVKMSSCL